MPRRHRIRPSAAPVVLFTLLAGCNDGTPPVDSSTNEGTIKGVVTYKGQPVNGGDIIFDPSNYLRKVGGRPAPIGPDGAFVARTYTGNNRIKVGGALLKAHPELFYLKKFMDVKYGENELDIELVDGGDPMKNVPGGKMPRIPAGAGRKPGAGRSG